MSEMAGMKVRSRKMNGMQLAWIPLHATKSLGEWWHCSVHLKLWHFMKMRSPLHDPDKFPSRQYPSTLRRRVWVGRRTGLRDMGKGSMKGTVAYVKRNSSSLAILRN